MLATLFVSRMTTPARQVALPNMRVLAHAYDRSDPPDHRGRRRPAAARDAAGARPRHQDHRHCQLRSERRLATAVETIARKQFTPDAARILDLARARGAVGFVLGLPVNMDGSEGPRAQSTRAFARNFARLTELPIALWDERLSTAAVERDLIAADVSRAKRAAVVDQHAAAFILQGALDRLRMLSA